MDDFHRIERALERTIDDAAAKGCPPRLAEALRYAVFPGGARIRPRLCLAVAGACGDDSPELSVAAAVAIELLHCASLVHDDLPCFDDAQTRRGKPSVHCAYGEDLAVLTGDALIVAAFERLVASDSADAGRIVGLSAIVARSVGAPAGIVAGQAWESETQIILADYHRAKTGALFAAATEAGAVAAQGDGAAWRRLGEKLGEAYQVADDLKDVFGSAGSIGKPVNQDAKLGRPSAVQELGPMGAAKHLEKVVADAADAIPPCERAPVLKAMILAEAKRFVPSEMSLEAA